MSGSEERRLAYSERLAERIRQVFGTRKDVVEKKMFGGVAFMLRGNLCVGVMKQSLLARVGVEAAEAAANSPHVELAVMGQRQMKGWIVVDPDGLDSEEDLARWIALSTTFVETLPPK